ncbi:MAG: TPM domain-containing protein [Bacteroidales bacterium]|jgi:uncharacterized membrane protein
MRASSFFTREQLARIKGAIEESEKATSGEIRVHLETSLAGDVLDRAAWIFRRTGMQNTKHRNGVLIYLAIRNKKFAIIGDVGIHQKVPEGLWDIISQKMQNDFKDKKFTEGLIKGILMAGEKLREYFPHQEDDINELPDEITFDDPDLTRIG